MLADISNVDAIYIVCGLSSGNDDLFHTSCFSEHDEPPSEAEITAYQISCLICRSP